MSEDINPLAPAEDASQEEAPSAEAQPEDINAPAPAAEEATSAPIIPAWAVMPDVGRTGAAPEESAVEAEADTGSPAEKAEAEAPEYDGARIHHHADNRMSQGT